jgi:hypothetical protein
VHLSDALKSLGSFVFSTQPVHQFCSAEAGRLLDRRMPANSRAAVSLHSPFLTFSSFGINPIRPPIIIPVKATGLEHRDEEDLYEVGRPMLLSREGRPAMWANSSIVL